MVEGARLESEYTSKAYRGFESHPLRHWFPYRVIRGHALRETTSQMAGSLTTVLLDWRRVFVALIGRRI